MTTTASAMEYAERLERQGLKRCDVCGWHVTAEHVEPLTVAHHDGEPLTVNVCRDCRKGIQ